MQLFRNFSRMFTCVGLLVFSSFSCTEFFLFFLQVLAMILTLKIWLVYCLEAKEKPMTFDHTKAPVQCRPDEGQFYQIEMENKHGQ